MLAHGTRNPSAFGTARGHVPAIRYVISASLLIRSQKVCSQHDAVLFVNKRFLLGRKPKRKRLLTTHVSRQRIRFASPEHRLENCPDCIAITVSCSSNGHDLLCTRRLGIGHSSLCLVVMGLLDRPKAEEHGSNQQP